MPKAAAAMSEEEFRRLFRRREEGWRRLEQWQTSNPLAVPPESAWSGIALLYELLPPESRIRPVDTAGVQRMHQALAALNAGSP